MTGPRVPGTVRPGTGARALRAATAAGTLAGLALTGHTAHNLRRVRRPSSQPPVAGEPVSVLLPLRDEAHRVEPTLRGLLAQRSVPDLEILVLDDGSTDGTSDVVRRAVAGDPRVRLIDGGPLPPPPGWLGKPWACHRLAAQARGSVLVFVDAEVHLSPDALAGTVELLRRNDLDLVAPYPRQIAVSAVERIVQPLVVWAWLTTLPLGPAERAPFPSLAAAAGQLLAVDAAAYRACGGHRAVQHAVLEDVALLRALKRNGFRGVPADGSQVATCRMYDSAGAVYHGYTKSLWSAFGSPGGALAVTLVLLGTYVLPPVAALLARDRRTRAWGAVGYAGGLVGRLLIATRTGERGWPDALAHPLSIIAFAGLTVSSLARRRWGRPTWKGRPVG